MPDNDPQVKDAPPASKASDETNPNAVLARDVTVLPSDVTIAIKGTGGSEFKITGQASEIQKIGDLLRGRPKGWGDFLRTAGIAGAASVTTIIFSSLIGSQFQFSSWANTVAVDSAKDRRDKAREAFNEAISAIGKRLTVTRDFISTLQDLVSSQSTPHENLPELNLELDRARMKNYYDTLDEWKAAYNALLATVDYALDRQVYRLAGTNPGNPVSYTKTQHVDCSQMITEQMRRPDVAYEQHSLKAQLAIINRCFNLISAKIEELKTNALSNAAFTLDPKVLDTLDHQLDDVDTTTNTFQCYAKHRQEFYNSQIRTSVIGATKLFYLRALASMYGQEYALSYLHAQQKPAVLEHFKSSDSSCDRSIGQLAHN
jgi:hypothetical protein